MDGGYGLTVMMNMVQEEFGGFEIQGTIDGYLLKISIGDERACGLNSFPHGFHCTLVRLAEGQMFVNHML